MNNDNLKKELANLYIFHKTLNQHLDERKALFCTVIKDTSLHTVFYYVKIFETDLSPLKSKGIFNLTALVRGIKIPIESFDDVMNKFFIEFNNSSNKKSYDIRRTGFEDFIQTHSPKHWNYYIQLKKLKTK